VRVVCQRVTEARVHVGGESRGEIGPGLVALVGIARGDDSATVLRLAAKVVRLQRAAARESSTYTSSGFTRRAFCPARPKLQKPLVCRRARTRLRRMSRHELPRSSLH